jgi:hypothetical protein
MVFPNSRVGDFEIVTTSSIVAPVGEEVKLVFPHAEPMQLVRLVFSDPSGAADVKDSDERKDEGHVVTLKVSGDPLIALNERVPLMPLSGPLEGLWMYVLLAIVPAGLGSPLRVIHQTWQVGAGPNESGRWSSRVKRLRAKVARIRKQDIEESIAKTLLGTAAARSASGGQGANVNF